MFANSRGSASLEQVLTMTAVIGCMAALLFFGSIGASKIWLHYTANEAGICLASDASRDECAQQFRDRTQILERIGHMRNFQLTATPSLAAVEWHFTVTGFHDIRFDIDGEVSFALPLRKKSEAFV